MAKLHRKINLLEIYNKTDAICQMGNNKKECLAISGSLELRTEVGKQSVEVANPQTSKSWNQSVHERTSAASCEFACVMHIVHICICICTHAKSLEEIKAQNHPKCKDVLFISKHIQRVVTS